MVKNRFVWMLSASLALWGGMVLADVTKPVGRRASTSIPYAGKRATAVVFVGVSCPIANRHAPELAALAKSAKARGGQLVLVYSNPGDQAEAAAHAKKYGLSDVTVLLDSNQTIKASLGAKVTPHAFVLNADGKVLYQGRISDDGGAGQAKPRGAAPLHHELAAALNATLTGKPIKVAKTEAVGCTIEPFSPARGGQRALVTYAEHIAPILNANCVSCHRAGEIGPMALDSYASAKHVATNIAQVSQKRVMPPWKPVDGHGEFSGVRKLTEAQIQLLSLWAESGAPAGELAKAPAPPKFAKGWTLGEPDLILKMPQSYQVAPSGADVYRCFVIPTNVTQDKEVVAVEYRAGNKAVVHHVIGYLDTQGRARKMDEAEAGPGYTSFGGPGFLPSGELDGWAPGKLPYFLPDGIARPLPKGSDLVMQVHYHSNGKPEEDLTQVGIYFAKKPATKRLGILPLIAPLSIPAGEASYKTSSSTLMPFDAKAIFVIPHMHLLGREIGIEAILPNGKKLPLIQINDWDFNWQDTYNYKEFVSLPKGTQLTLRARYDNSAANPRQPNNPPKDVAWGEATTDEMSIAFIGYIADNENDPMVKLFASFLGGGKR
ncbi:redoxin family protein [Armatimonas sp.]|uniref:redoxin family protein n=1 Tax=Armatimonas sp. TaxID=1872638 RepID=UPI00286D2E40|nr:redoxin family protein [Armatimonas sp.]